MERRVLLAISLSFLVLFVVPDLLRATAAAPRVRRRRPPARQACRSAAVAAQPPATPTPAPAAAAGSVLSRGEPLSGISPSRPAPCAPSSRIAAAASTHWVLKDYQNDAGQPLDLVPDAENVNNALIAVLAAAGRCRSQSKPSTAASIHSAVAQRRRRAPRARRPSRSSGGAGGVPVTQGIHAAAGWLHRVRLRRACNATARSLNPTVDWGPGLGDDIAYASARRFLVAELFDAGPGAGASRRSVSHGCRLPAPATETGRSCTRGSTITISPPWS